MPRPPRVNIGECRKSPWIWFDYRRVHFRHDLFRTFWSRSNTGPAVCAQSVAVNVSACHESLQRGPEFGRILSKVPGGNGCVYVVFVEVRGSIDVSFCTGQWTCGLIKVQSFLRSESLLKDSPSATRGTTWHVVTFYILHYSLHWRGKYVRRWCSGHCVYYQGEGVLKSYCWEDYPAVAAWSYGNGEEGKATGVVICCPRVCSTLKWR